PRDAGQSCAASQRVASLDAPETPRLAVIDIENQQPVRQAVVGQRMTGSAPLAEQDQPWRQRLAQTPFVIGQPGGQARKLASEGWHQILAAVLHPQTAIGSEGNAEVGTVELFLQDHLAGKQGLRLGAVQHFIVTRLARSKPRKVRCVGKAKERLTHLPLTGKAGTACPGYFFR